MGNVLRDNVEEKQERLERMIAEYERRRLVERGIRLWNRTEEELRLRVERAVVLPLTIN